ncbi:MAG: heme exporter protein CcmD [Gammaproteobacteria bacterium]|nr:heme exporter protein CcmD [Gammaproteobacteria bacterium]
MTEFFAMNGHGFYIWTSYGIALILLVANLVWPALYRRKLLQTLKSAQTRKDKLARRQA